MGNEDDKNKEVAMSESSKSQAPPPPPAGSSYAPHPTTGQTYPPYGYGPTATSSPPHAYGGGKYPPGGPPQGQPREYLGQWQDVWAAVIFLIHFVAVQVVAVYLAYRGISESLSDTPPPPAAAGTTVEVNSYDYEFSDWIAPLAVSVAVGLVISWLWLQLVKLMPKTMIYVSLWWGVVVSAVLGSFLLYTSADTRFVGIIFLILAVLQLIYAIVVRDRIPFAATMLRQAVYVVRKYPSTVWVSYLGLLVSLEWIFVWVLGAAGAVSLTNATIVIFLLLLSLYWSMEVIRNTVHVTTAGTVATYYFQRLNMPPNPTGRSLKRALTKSFGSICLGSFIVGFLQACRAIVASMRAENQDSAVAAIIASCAECILACIESLVQYFNKWAYVQVAIYGKSFVRAAKDTWDLFESQGFNMIINDDLTSGVLLLGCLISGMITALLAGVWTYQTHEEIAVSIAIIAFFIGYFMCYLTMAVIESAVATYYVCYAEDPITLQRNDPEFYEAIRSRSNFLMQRLTL